MTIFNSESFRNIEQKDFSNVFLLANPATSPYLTYLMQKGVIPVGSTVVSKTFDKLNEDTNYGGQVEGGEFEEFVNAGSETVDNYCEIFRKQVKISGTALAMAGRNGMQLIETLKITAEMKRDIDKALLIGEKSSSGGIRKMDGIVNIGKKVDAQFTQEEVDKAMLYLPIGDLVLIINPANKRKVHDLLLNEVGFTYNQNTSEIGLNILEYTSHLGHKVEILLDPNLPTDYYIFQSIEDAELNELRPIQAVELAKTNDAQGFGLLWEGTVLASKFNTYVINSTATFSAKKTK